MKLGQFINGVGSALQGKVVISVWDGRWDGEIDRIEFETDGGLRGFKKAALKGLLSCEICFMFANDGIGLVIEIEKEG